ncbi:MAG: hypothetical protein DRQ51_08210 [Gammaproteobacteria bacterium]|nr:MAG: hypothetical protein DRQ51_08210 [Gammaproteobacteria bacterium]
MTIPIAPIYPWQTNVFDGFIKSCKSLKSHHAIMLTGLSNIGKIKLAYHMAKSVLCKNTQGNNACQKCDSCLQFDNNSHPDFHQITPPTYKQKTVGIEQIRQTNKQIINKSFYGGYQIFLISIQSITTEAANAFLKSLEEPSDKTIIILICDNKHKILPTIISRCLLFNIKTPNKNDLINYYSSQYESIFAHNFNRPALIEKAIGNKNYNNIRHNFFKNFFLFINDNISLEYICKITTDENLEPIMMEFVHSIIMDILLTITGIESAKITNQDFISDITKNHRKYNKLKIIQLLKYINYIRSISQDSLNTDTLHREIFARIILAFNETFA